MPDAIVVHLDRCTGCDLCALVCSYQQKSGFNPRHALLRLERDGMGVPVGMAFSRQCQVQPVDPCAQRPRPACEEACPFGALEWTACAP